jgi:hypothetical protein
MTNPARRKIDLAMSEAEWTTTVIGTERDRGLARTLGWTCLHVNDSRREVVDRLGNHQIVGDADAAGLPDWILLRERIVWVELKRERGTMRPTQTAIIAAIRKAGGEAYVWRPSDWPEVVLALTGRWRGGRGANDWPVTDGKLSTSPTRTPPDVDRRTSGRGVSAVDTGGAT